MVLRLGVIGAGSWAAAAHLPTLAARDEVAFVAVSRKGPEALARVARRWGFPVASEDYLDVIDAHCDIVVVSSPSACHHEHAKAALESGAHVLCEKPMTITPEQAWELVETARLADRQLLVSFGWNYQPIVRQAVELLGDHPIGPLEHLTIHMSSATRELLSNTGAYPDADPDSLPEHSTWTDPLVSGGGYGQAQLSHALGLAYALVPEDVNEVFAIAASPLGATVDLHDAAVLRFDGGAVGVLSGGSNHAGASGNKHELEVRGIGRDGQFIVDVHRELVWVHTRDEGSVTADLPRDAGLYDASGPANALVSVALGDKSENRAPGELGARTVQTLDLLYQSLRTGSAASR